MPAPPATEPLLDVARALLSRSYAPYSGASAAVALFSAEGVWVPGVRVENASFSLTLPALRNALTTAAALGAAPTVAVASTAPLTPGEEVELRAALGAEFAEVAPGVWSAGPALPAPAGPHPPFLDAAPPADAAAGIALARQVAGRAHVPHSDFRVGCVAALPDGRLVPGVNVEPPDWSHIVCAERNALGTLVSYGLGSAATLYLACLPCDCSPCGACRQVITELAPEARLWMPRAGTPFAAQAADLLPERFTGQTLRR